jgi:hypothetical protein
MFSKATSPEILKYILAELTNTLGLMPLPSGTHQLLVNSVLKVGIELAREQYMGLKDIAILSLMKYYLLMNGRKGESQKSLSDE